MAQIVKIVFELLNNHNYSNLRTYNLSPLFQLIFIWIPTHFLLIKCLKILLMSILFMSIQHDYLLGLLSVILGQLWNFKLNAFRWNRFRFKLERFLNIPD